MNKYMIPTLLSLVVVFSACGGGSSGSGSGSSIDSNDSVTDNGDSVADTITTPQTQDVRIVMESGVIYTMSSGQSIKKDTDNTDSTITILETDIETGVTTAYLKSGSASIYTP